MLHSSAVERLTVNQDVRGSIPREAANYGSFAQVAQWQEANVLGTLQCRFESDLEHQILSKHPIRLIGHDDANNGPLTQLAECRPFKSDVGGSIPSRPTISTESRIAAIPPALGAGYRGFESHFSDQFMDSYVNFR